MKLTVTDGFQKTTMRYGGKEYKLHVVWEDGYTHIYILSGYEQVAQVDTSVVVANEKELKQLARIALKNQYGHIAS